MTTDAHAPLAPSSAHIWGARDGCRASVAMQAAYPEPQDSDEAREGTAAHWYAAELLNGRDVPLGAIAPNGVPISAEMVDCAQALLVDVRDTFASCVRLGGNPVLYVERRVFMPIVHEANWGTLDVQIVDQARRFMFVWDYKYGHRFVDARANLQLIDYGVGTLREIPPYEWPLWTVVLTVVQPRNYDPIGPVREWRVNGQQLLDVYVPQLFEAAKVAMAPNAPFQTGAHCRDCSARYPCPALQQAGALAMDVSLQGHPIDLPPHAVGLELRQIDDAIKRLEARKTGLEEQALGLIRGGTLVPFFTTEHTSGRERYIVPADQVFALGEMFGVDARKPPEPITPAQLRKAGVDAATVDAFAEKPKGALRLKRVDDDAAKLAFG